MYYEPSLHARTVQLPVFSTFEVVAVFLHRASFNAVVVYRPGSCNTTQSFFDDFCDLLECLSTLSAPLMIAGDFNIHVDDATDTHAVIVYISTSTQYSPTHVHGHTLDLLITRESRRPERRCASGRPAAVVRPRVRRRRLQLSAVAVYDLNRVSSSTQLARTRCRRLRRRPATVRAVSGTTSRP